MHNTRPWTRRHICKWDRDPNVRPPALCRVYKATDSRSVISFIKTMADLSDTDTDVEELIDGAEESSENAIMRNMIGFNYYYENPHSFDNIWTQYCECASLHRMHNIFILHGASRPTVYNWSKDFICIYLEY